MQLAALGEDNLPELAGKADIIMAAKHAQPVINASNHPPRKHSPARRSPKDTICWYHAKFGNEAKACRPPCLFSVISKTPPLKFGKRSGQQIVAQVAGQNPSRLLYVWEGTSSLSILELRSAFFWLPPMIAVGRRQNP